MPRKSGPTSRSQRRPKIYCDKWVFPSRVVWTNGRAGKSFPGAVVILALLSASTDVTGGSLAASLRDRSPDVTVLETSSISDVLEARYCRKAVEYMKNTSIMPDWVTHSTLKELV
ncbi:hypothetical protein F5Y18DRAFT_431025 [Xylariaceae sp. FL1019]|nr:hypothetical protein F5Y18DRAFT_431025 [Xylariaceae sp. FL1019]